MDRTRDCGSCNGGSIPSEGTNKKLGKHCPIFYFFWESNEKEGSGGGVILPYRRSFRTEGSESAVPRMRNE